MLRLGKKIPQISSKCSSESIMAAHLFKAKYDKAQLLEIGNRTRVNVAEAKKRDDAYAENQTHCKLLLNEKENCSSQVSAQGKFDS